jgi:glycosyltransferase involved in cell wall biosynthesis
MLQLVEGVEEMWLKRNCLRLLGRRQDMARLLAAADVFVLPSLLEGQPLALLEAMASGIPCVVTRASGLDEFVADKEDGLLVPPMDSQALADAVYRLLLDAELARRLGNAAQKRARAFDVPSMLEALEGVYRGLLG